MARVQRWRAEEVRPGDGARRGGEDVARVERWSVKEVRRGATERRRCGGLGLRPGGAEAAWLGWSCGRRRRKRHDGGANEVVLEVGEAAVAYWQSDGAHLLILEIYVKKLYPNYTDAHLRVAAIAKISEVLKVDEKYQDALLMLGDLELKKDNWVKAKGTLCAAKEHAKWR